MEISLVIHGQHITLFVQKVLVPVSLRGFCRLTSLPPYPKEYSSHAKPKAITWHVHVVSCAWSGKRWRRRKYESLRHFLKVATSIEFLRITLLLSRCWALLAPSTRYNISHDGGVKMVKCQLLRRRSGIIFLTHKIVHVLSQAFAVEFYQLVTRKNIC